jgi:hypothetical protein
MTANAENTSYLKYKDKYYKSTRTTTRSGFTYKLTNPLNDNDQGNSYVVSIIDKKDEIPHVKLSAFISVLDICKRNREETVEYVYDVLYIKYKFTIQNLKKIDHMYIISNRDPIYKLSNIVKNPFNFITEALSLITFKKAEEIAKGEGLSIPFRELSMKWSYDSIRSSKMGYVPNEKFWKDFDIFCNGKDVDKNKYLSIVENVCTYVFNEKNKKFITSDYYLNLETSAGDRVMDKVQIDSEKVDECDILDMIGKYEETNNIKFNKEQKQAIINGINENFSIVIGYPGTGKTTIAQCIIWIYQELGFDKKHSIKISDFYDHTHRNNLEYEIFASNQFYSGISVLAPTGRAALNLTSKLKHFGLDPELSGTIHKSIYSTFPNISNIKTSFDKLVECAVLNEKIDRNFVNKYLFSALTDRERIFRGNSLEDRYYKQLKAFVNKNSLKHKDWFKNNKDFLTKNVNFIIIDEGSMIDTFIFSELLKWITLFDCKVLILGDENQLPAVDGGAVLEQMIKSTLVPLTRLTEIKRQEDSGGALVAVIKKMAIGKLVSIQEFDNKTICFEDMNQYLNSDKTYNFDKLNKDLLEKYNVTMDNSKILSYFKNKNYKFCTPDMNKMLQNKYNSSNVIQIPIPSLFMYNKEAIPFRVGDKIVRQVNDYTGDGKLLANGEEANIISYNKDTFEATIKYESLENNTVISTDDLYSDFTLAYAITIHKSQGGQHDTILFFIQNDMPVLNTRVVYTGISRAIKKCIIVSTPKIFKQVQLNPPEVRMSLFMEEFNDFVLE